MERGLAGTGPSPHRFIASVWRRAAFWRATASLRAWVGSRPVNTVAERLQLIGLRLAFGLALVATFGVGSIGAFLVFEWPPLLRTVVLAYLLAVLLIRLALVLGRVVLVPGGQGFEDPERYRVVPMGTASARYWHRRIALFIGYYAVGRATIGLLVPLGFSPEVRVAAAYTLGLGLLAIEATWRRPAREGIRPPRPRRVGRRRALLTIYGVVLWLLWVAGEGQCLARASPSDAEGDLIVQRPSPHSPDLGDARSEPRAG